MRRFMTKKSLPGVLVLAGIALTVGAKADSDFMPELARPSVTIYNVKFSSPSSVVIGGWGSGKCVQSKDVMYNGVKCLQITTNDLYSGGRIDLKTPLDISGPFNDGEAYLQIATKFSNTNTNTNQTRTGVTAGRGQIGRAGMPGMAGGMPGAAGGGMRAGGMPGGMAGGMPGGMAGGMPGGMAGGMPGGMAGGMPGGMRTGGMPGGMPGGMRQGGTAGSRQGNTANRFGATGGNTNRQVRRVRVVLALDTGQTLECQAEVSAFKPAKDGWTYLSLPMSAFKGKLNIQTCRIKRVIISADGSNDIYVGSVSTVSDPTPLQAFVSKDKVVAAFDKVPFNGSFISGATGVKYSWDFDQSDGIQEEAVGPVVSHQFRTPGNYVVTLTVSDIFGIKRPATAIVKVKVNP